MDYKINKQLAEDCVISLQSMPVSQFKTLGELAAALRGVNGLVGYSSIQESQEAILIQENEELKKELEELKKEK